ncbi:4Fe-4S binding protein [Cryptosporangium minutisporangium]|uniref:4Fe-4S binding protein n=1 Tax=Cryptosporangium minutisporangium TaxID=113569 RepID=A0ABP6T2S4_9ACTN
MSAPNRNWPAFHVPVDRSGGVRAHPTAITVRARKAEDPGTLDAAWLRELCTAAGADDVGFVALDTPGLEGERDYVLEAMPGTRSLIALCVRTSRDNLRSRSVSVGNRDVATTSEILHEAARHICLELQRRGVRALYPATGFPMEVQRYPGRSWVVSHKLVAVAAGLGHLGVHRNLIHPRFGNFLVLGTILLDAPVTEYSRPLGWNPCVGCNLCVVACPVGAIHADGSFDVDACSTHNNNHDLSSFAGWVEDIADSRDAADYRRRVTPGETISRWQSLSFSPQYRSGYCVAVCPAGTDVIGPFLADQEQHEREFLVPLQEKPEYVYVEPESDAEHYVQEHFPHKTIRHARRSDVPAPELDAAPAPESE